MMMNGVNRFVEWNPAKGGKDNPLSNELLIEKYGQGAFQFMKSDKSIPIVFSKSKSFDLVELEQLLESVGWSRRPFKRVKRALENSLLSVGLWQHDPKFPRLIGFARCTGDGVLEATIWDVAVHPIHHGSGLGKLLMKYLLYELRKIGIERVTLFADPGVVEFYENQGWELEPKGNKCAFWYAN